MIYFDKQIQEEIDHIKFQIKYLNGDEEFTEDIKDENPIIEAFQKNNLKNKIELYKKSIKLFEKALKIKPPAVRMKDNVSFFKERNNLIREAMLADLNADVLNLFYDKKDVEIREEFQEFKSNLK